MKEEAQSVESSGISPNFRGEPHAEFNTDSDGEESDQPTKRKKKQGTFVGVFCPVLQNIIGIILFLRMPYVTGEAGLWKTLCIIFLCSGASSLTILSLSAIATNGKIKAGGTYYLLSRSLGPATGGAVGILFYVATLLSGAMYIIGAVEAFLVSTGLNLGPSWFSL